jgi:hypothetical protein
MEFWKSHKIQHAYILYIFNLLHYGLFSRKPLPFCHNTGPIREDDSHLSPRKNLEVIELSSK